MYDVYAPPHQREIRLTPDSWLRGDHTSCALNFMPGAGAQCVRAACVDRWLQMGTLPGHVCVCVCVCAHADLQSRRDVEGGQSALGAVVTGQSALGICVHCCQAPMPDQTQHKRCWPCVCGCVHAAADLRCPGAPEADGGAPGPCQCGPHAHFPGRQLQRAAGAALVPCAAPDHVPGPAGEDACKEC